MLAVSVTPPAPPPTPVWESSLVYLFVGGGVVHTPAEGLRAREARRAGQAVVAGVGVLTPVLAVVVEAGVGYFFALWEERQ